MLKFTFPFLRLSGSIFGENLLCLHPFSRPFSPCCDRDLVSRTGQRKISAMWEVTCLIYQNIARIWPIPHTYSFDSQEVWPFAPYNFLASRLIEVDGLYLREIKCGAKSFGRLIY